MTTFQSKEAGHLRRAIELAYEAREKGNAPFGAVLVGEDGGVLAEAGNTVNTGHDVAGHAETNLVREACRIHDAETLAASTLYSSAEPCAMCAATIFWGGVGRVVYGISAERLYEMFPADDGNRILRLYCREVLNAGSTPTEVVGPALEEEASRVFEEGME